MQAFNHSLFLVINAPSHPDTVILFTATLVAVYAIWLVPATLLLGWLRGGEHARGLMLQAAVSGLIALLLNQMIGLVWQQPRPFMIGLGHTFIAHAADSSFPSDHLTLLWAVAFSLRLNQRTEAVGFMLALLGLPMAWARIYLGVHFPMDMLGAALVAGGSAWLCFRNAHWFVEPCLRWLNPVYRRLFAPLIRRNLARW